MKKEYFAALKALDIARNHFEHAETGFIEAVRNGYLG